MTTEVHSVEAWDHWLYLFLIWKSPQGVACCEWPHTVGRSNQPCENLPAYSHSLLQVTICTFTLLTKCSLLRWKFEAYFFLFGHPLNLEHGLKGDVCSFQMAGGVCPIFLVPFVPAPHALGVGLFMCCLFITLRISVCSASIWAESQACNNSLAEDLDHHVLQCPGRRNPINELQYVICALHLRV